MIVVRYSVFLLIGVLSEGLIVESLKGVGRDLMLSLKLFVEFDDCKLLLLTDIELIDKLVMNLDQFLLQN